ncbi:MAG: ImmA/IrrE family metallo-endopeptidase [Candidatus Cloacimonetes bacterium]|nr:ImmA/IrrE family metallo-endopeptidase [Candidatus Cloacimonadota bacterium]
MSFDLKVIKSAKDYHIATEKLSILMDHNPNVGSKEYKLMELLIVLIEKYEDEKFDLGTLDPIEAVKIRMGEKGLKQRDLVSYIGSPVKVSEVLNRKRNLTFEMMKSLSEVLDIPAEVFFRYKTNSMPSTTSTLENRIPLKEIVGKHWLPYASSIGGVAKKSKELLSNFFSNKVFYDFAFSNGTTYKRQLIRKGSNIDEVSLATWIYMVLELASNVRTPKSYSKSMLTDEAIATIRNYSNRCDGPLLVRDYLLSLGIILVILPHLKKTHIDGAAMMMPNKRNPIIALTLRHDRVDNFWFCLFHELGHILHHLSSNMIIAENLDVIDDDDNNEREADAFARNKLIPEDSWNAFYMNGLGNFSPESVERYARNIGINPAIVAGRIRYQTQRWMILSRMVGHHEIRKVYGNEYYSLA